MAGKKDPILQALMEPGDQGDHMRHNLEAALEAGAGDPSLCLQLAELCEARGHPGLALWFLGVGFRYHPEAAADARTRLAELVLAAGTLADYLERRGDKLAGLRAVFATLDGLDDATHSGAMTLLEEGLSETPERVSQMAERYAVEDGLANSESFLAILLQVGWDGAAEKLLALEAPKPWTLEALAGKNLRR